MSTATTTPDVQRIARVAGVLSYRDLPQPLQADADRFLVAHAEALGQEGVSGYEIRAALESALLLIAAYEVVPPPDAAGDEHRMLAAFGLTDNPTRRHAVNDPTGPLCLPLRLWNLLRQHAIQKGDVTPPPEGAQYCLGERLFFTAGRIDVPAEFDAWFDTDEAGKHYQDWRARRAEQTATTEAAPA